MCTWCISSAGRCTHISLLVFVVHLYMYEPITSCRVLADNLNYLLTNGVCAELCY